MRIEGASGQMDVAQYQGRQRIVIVPLLLLLIGVPRMVPRFKEPEYRTNLPPTAKHCLIGFFFP